MDRMDPAPAELNRHLPLWYQVAQHLLLLIRGRDPADGLRLPTEPELARHYGVGLVTLREALRWLEQQGLIIRQRRRGTFINPAASLGRKLALDGTLEGLFAQQQAEETALLDQSLVATPPDLRGHFPGQPELMRFRRLRREAGRPMSLAVNWLPAEIGARVPLERLRDWPMTRVLRDAMGLHVAAVEQTIEATLALPETAHLLEVPLLSPILLITGVNFDPANQVLDVARLEYRGERVRYQVRFEVPAAPVLS